MKPRARHQGILATDVGNEVVLYDEIAKKAHRLNQSAAFVWQRSDGARTVAELADLLGMQFGSRVDQGVVWIALENLQEAGLLTEQIDIPVRVDRAAFIKKVAVAAALIPVVYSIAAPTPAMAESAGGGTPVPPCPDGWVEVGGQCYQVDIG